MIKRKVGKFLLLRKAQAAAFLSATNSEPGRAASDKTRVAVFSKIYFKI